MSRSGWVVLRELEALFHCRRLTLPIAISAMAACIVSFSSRAEAIQDKPSDQQLAALVQQVIGGQHNMFDYSPVAFAASLNGIGSPVVAELQTFKVSRWGQSTQSYLPVEVCARVRAHNSNAAVLAEAGWAKLERKVFDVRLRMRIAKDDFGDWRVQMIRMEHNEPIRNSLCSVGSDSVASSDSPLGGLKTATREGNSLAIEEALVAAGVRNGEPVGRSDRFPANVRTIVCYTVVAHEQAGQRIEYVWIQPDGRERARTSTVLRAPRPDPDEAQFATSILTPRAPLQTGAWRIDVYVDGAMIKQVAFTVY